MHYWVNETPWERKAWYLCILARWSRIYHHKAHATLPRNIPYILRLQEAVCGFLSERPAI